MKNEVLELAIIEEVWSLFEAPLGYNTDRSEELNIYVDESGNLGNRTANSKYYIIGMVFKRGSVSIIEEEDKLEEEFTRIGYPDTVFHMGNLIHGKKPYEDETEENKIKLMRVFYSFVKHIDITHKEFWVEKKNLSYKEIQRRLSSSIREFIEANYLYFLSFSRVNVYYDNGQKMVSKIIDDVFRKCLYGVNIVSTPQDGERLMQVADLTSTFKLLELKIETQVLSRMERDMFETDRNIKRKYLRPLMLKEFQ